MKKSITPKWLDHLIVGAVIAYILYILYFAFVPPWLHGWQMHCVSYDQGMSMATDRKDGGVMPFDMYYIAPTQSFAVGDTISFNNQHEQNSELRGQSLKELFAITNGWYYSRGKNEACSYSRGWFACRIEDISGKRVAGTHPILPIPSAFWRWASMNWALGYDDLSARVKYRLWSYNLNWFTIQGRHQNRVMMDHAISTIYWRGKCWGEDVSTKQRHHFRIHNQNDEVVFESDGQLDKSKDGFSFMVSNGSPFATQHIWSLDKGDQVLNR